MPNDDQTFQALSLFDITGVICTNLNALLITHSSEVFSVTFITEAIDTPISAVRTTYFITKKTLSLEQTIIYPNKKEL